MATAVILLKEFEAGFATLQRRCIEWPGDACGVGKRCQHYRDLEQAVFVGLALLKQYKGQPTVGQVPLPDHLKEFLFGG